MFTTIMKQNFDVINGKLVVKKANDEVIENQNEEKLLSEERELA